MSEGESEDSFRASEEKSDDTEESMKVATNTEDAPLIQPAAPVSGKELDELLLKAKEGEAEFQRAAGVALLYKSATESADLCDATAQRGVKLLCDASRQGDEPATEALRDALQRGQGLNDENLEMVKWCIRTSSLEKKARIAARGLFRAINPLSPNQDLLDELSKHERKLLEKAMKVGDNEELFVEKVMKRFHGAGGLSLDTILQSNVEMEAFNNASFATKMRKYPGKSLAVLFERTIDSAGSQGLSWLRKLIPTNQIYMVLAFFFYSLITLDFVLWFLPLALFSFGMLVMSISTMQMFYSRRKRSDVSSMAKLLGRFNDALEHESAESSYDWNTLTPYASFFISLIVTVAAFSLADSSWIPCSELVVLNMLFCGTCFYALSDSYDNLLVFAIILDFISSLPTYINALPHVPYIKPALVFMAGNIWSHEILEDVFINFGIPSIAYLVVPLIFLKMAYGKSWKGWYQILIPHLVCFSWWKTGVLFFGNSSWLGLGRACFGWLTFLMLFPIAVIIAATYFMYHLMEALTFTNILTVIVTLGLMALPILLGFWAKGGLKLDKLSISRNPLVKRGVLLCVFILSFSAIFLNTPIEKDVEGRFMTWKQYERYCSLPQYSKTNIADAQLKCSHFKDVIVEWSGKVKKIVVKETHNQAEDFLGYLPNNLADWVKCAYGEKYPDCDKVEDIDAKNLCKLATMQGQHTCHISNMDIYLFEMWVTMAVTDEVTGEMGEHDVRVEATNWFKDSMLLLSEGDKVTFRAALKGQIGNTWPELKLYYVSCADKGVQYGSRSRLSETSWRVIEQVRRGIFTTWNFFFAPVFELKDQENPLESA